MKTKQQMTMEQAWADCINGGSKSLSDLVQSSMDYPELDLKKILSMVRCLNDKLLDFKICIDAGLVDNKAVQRFAMTLTEKQCQSIGVEKSTHTRVGLFKDGGKPVPMTVGFQPDGDTRDNVRMKYLRAIRVVR